MRAVLSLSLTLATLAPAAVAAQEPVAPAPVHVAVESSSLVLDQERVRRVGIDGVVLHAGQHAAAPRVSVRVGGLSVSAWLDAVRGSRAVRRETTQRIVALSGSAARVASVVTMSGPYGQSASAGPELWVEPVALDDGRVRLRLWTAVSDLRAGPFGTVWQETPVEASTEIVVPSGTPVLVASSESAEARSERGILSRGGTESNTRTWIVVTPRIVHDPADAFALPEGIPGDWIRR